ncbi:hypothetical protein JSY14_11835 [Brachybacterium sp. EF45031]|uniref:FUSC family protein n=1 Tax=Brachybacterium sillae TaxID=2810536 RepID=UPI00217ED71D|nr:FUSC family protein [Brachybacterium sillae]MCS6712674.1 hypothetical protein [Brachybacterium sillae]
MPEEITGRELDAEVREELRALSKETAHRVSRHLVAATALLDGDPLLALRHAQFAARLGGRIGAVREVYGVVAYENGEYRTAIRELRTAMRITGRHDLVPLLADSERGLGRPEKALDLAASTDVGSLDAAATIELMIVVAGAYADTGDVATALASLEGPALRHKVGGAWPVRLWVAYADLLDRAERREEARRWLTLAADADTEGLTDAAERLGRPPVVPPQPQETSWEDDESVTVVDAWSDEDEDSEGDADEGDDSRQRDAHDEMMEEREGAPEDATEQAGIGGSGATESGATEEGAATDLDRDPEDDAA